MFILLLFLALLLQQIYSFSLSIKGGDVVYGLPVAQSLPINFALGTRSTFHIVFSCLLTIFTCTWTAIHPNIPSPTDSRWDIYKRRIVTAVYALWVPECMTYWAYRQHVGAKRIVKEYNMEIAKRM